TMSFKQWLRKMFGPRAQASGTSRRGKARQPSRYRFRLQLERLEERLAPANILTVTSSSDSEIIPGTLPYEILASVNRNHGGTGTDTIQFSPTIDGSTIILTSFSNNLGMVGTTELGPSAFFLWNSVKLVID